MITGGTGSFGKAVLNKFIDTDFAEIRVFSRDEKKQEDLRISMKNSKVKFYIGDVRDINSLDQAMKGVNYVFHGAALKQVPSCEFYPMEAVKTNILGSENVMNAALNRDVEKVIMLSTDKAVYPVNAMGISKAMMERLMIAKACLNQVSKTKFISTRYGNVMSSRGSVIPLFVNQILKNEPITITDPHMTRFLMSLDESVQLVLTAFSEGENGDILVKKSPSSTINNLAMALMEIFNKKVETKIIGTRHGEKLYEVLVSREEMSRTKEFGDFYKIKADNRDLNYDKFFTSGKKNIKDFDDYSSNNAKRLEINEIKTMLLNDKYIKDVISA
jgi:UDP-glucose 4-epimerase|tara:strand:- start:244 stop:1233 length:990 start_codon:yes stop_codon:yes gene_type:complete